MAAQLSLLPALLQPPLTNQLTSVHWTTTAVQQHTVQWCVVEVTAVRMLTVCKLPAERKLIVLNTIQCHVTTGIDVLLVFAVVKLRVCRQCAVFGDDVVSERWFSARC